MIKLFSQNNCKYCVILKNKLKSWDINFEEINISEIDEGKQFLKAKGHRTVPQLYLENFNLNADIETIDFTEEVLYDRLDTFIAENSEEDIDRVIRLYEETPDI